MQGRTTSSTGEDRNMKSSAPLGLSFLRIIMNPKAMTIDQMYGYFDELNEWNDGILATTYRLAY